MNTKLKLITVGALGLAGVALLFLTRKPGGQVHAQPGQAQRDAGLQTWSDQLDAQRREIEGTSYALSIDGFKDLLGAPRK